MTFSPLPRSLNHSYQGLQTTLKEMQTDLRAGVVNFWQLMVAIITVKLQKLHFGIKVQAIQIQAIQSNHTTVMSFLHDYHVS
ncbi:hypothetical protein FQR65_LT07990 [Abscondita terminalis]|nr:hypothetical protein FQR65_LT07990 [Abscondita terminalis]